MHASSPPKADPTETPTPIPAFAKDLLRAISGPTEPLDPQAERAALAVLATLSPDDSLGQMLAVQAVGAHYAVLACFRAVLAPDVTPAEAHRLRRNAAALGRMTRESIRALRQKRAHIEPPVTLEQLARAQAAARSGSAIAPGVSPSQGAAEPPVAGVPGTGEQPLFCQQVRQAEAARDAVKTVPSIGATPGAGARVSAGPRPEQPVPTIAPGATKTASVPAAAIVPANGERPKPSALAAILEELNARHPLPPLPQQPTQKHPKHDLMVKISNGDAMRDFMSRRFKPGESVAEAWAAAKQQSAQTEAEADDTLAAHVAGSRH